MCKAKQILQAAHPHANAYFIGFTPWRIYLEQWFANYSVHFIKRTMPVWLFRLWHLLWFKKKPESLLFVWGYKIHPSMRRFFEARGYGLHYVEDGFLRSVALGAKRQPPCSLTIDTQAPYFDATRTTDLEGILADYDFDADTKLMARAQRVCQLLLASGLSKYNQARPIDIHQVYGNKSAKKRVLVLGQVEDDASLVYGCERPIGNDELVRLACEENPAAQVFYKPHPDVLHGYRQKKADPNHGHCRMLVEDIPISQAFETVDHVYTMTSLAGFEALLRGIKVTTLGCPFYAGWGVTDTRQFNPRRTRKLTVLQIFAAAYLLYPVYLDVTSGTVCEIEDVITYLKGCT